MDSPKATAQTFTCFPDLPLELRLKIWRHCRPGPRVVVFGQQYEHRISAGVWFPSPTILFVNRESRAETLLSYSLIKKRHRNTFSFNSWRDTLLLYPLDDDCSYVKPHAGPNFHVRSLQIPLASVVYGLDRLLTKVSRHRNLQELVVWEYDERGANGVVPVTVMSEDAEIEMWFESSYYPRILRNLISSLKKHSDKFPGGQIPVLKFTRTRENLRESTDQGSSQFCYAGHSVTYANRFQVAPRTDS